MKYFRMSYEEVVFRRSYLNILLLNRSIPSSDNNDDDSKDRDRKKGKKKGNHTYKNETELFMSLM